MQMPRVGLERLRVALMRNDPRLLQDSSIFPIASELTENERVECGCAVCYCLWQGAGACTVGELAERFARVCDRADELVGEVAASRLFFNWYDNAPRWHM